jgi:hypothetical protein
MGASLLTGAGISLQMDTSFDPFACVHRVRFLHQEMHVKQAILVLVQVVW